MKITIELDSFDDYRQLSKEDIQLVEKAREALKKAYAPYSKFKVGASLLLENGEILLGNNQENVAYPSGLCAERVVLFNAGANYSDHSIKTLCIAAEGDLIQEDQILSPCGACRQVMLESEVRQQKKYRIILISSKGNGVIFHSAKDLLPIAFGE